MHVNRKLFPFARAHGQKPNSKTINTLIHSSLPCPRFAQLLSLGYMIYALLLPEHLLWATTRDREMG